ncbi:hypothetical protein Nepgr_019411 [Nepenthes gracilis]|uniref:Nuclear pore complex protein n=1 Tax=Nepenthes gracilis TaxID=150966 RepID=A0AAD3STI2_NEPGR|nr:hypothetical protein Nepgr_019411 [Nepenthes gracilis]
METSPSYFDPKDLSAREQYRRYGKRQSASGISPRQNDSTFNLSGGTRSNAALFLEDIKQEVENLEGSRTHSAYKRRSPDSHGLFEFDAAIGSVRHSGSYSLKACKIEDDALLDAGETTFSLFASLFDSALQGSLSIPDLILEFEKSCRDVSESIRYGSNGRHQILEDRLMRQKAQFLLDEAASWSLLWHLYGKGNKEGKPRLVMLQLEVLNFNICRQKSEEIPDDLTMSPSTSLLEACQFVATNLTAQLCLRIVQWLEGLASKALDLENKIRGSHIGTYLPWSGIWHNTQRQLKSSNVNPDTVHYLDFDAPTRENALPLPNDRKQDESLLEDIWTLSRAGRLEAACELCRSAGQPWRSALLCPFGELDLVPSIEALVKNGKNRSLQAIELESGFGHQWRLWKWACYCASERIVEQGDGKYEAAVYAAQCSNLKCMLPICADWESAFWAMAKSWLDVQVDMELARLQPGRMDQFKGHEDATEGSPGQGDHVSQILGPEKWPTQVLNQQPRTISSLLQKLHSGDLVHEAVTRACKEQHRQIEMNLILGDIPRLLDLVWAWISPSDDADQSNFRLHGDPQMMRFGAHLVLVLRYLLGDQVQDTFREKIMNVGDLILHIYVMFLFSKQHEELIGIYASQLARHRCVDLLVHMMELQLNAGVHAKYKLFLSAIEYLPFSPGDDSRGSFVEIMERVLSRSRETKLGKYDRSSDVVEQHRLQSLEKAVVVQWLCFTPPPSIDDGQAVRAKLLLLALMHSNRLFREFALISMWRVPAMPSGAHKLLGFLAEPLKQPPENLLSSEEHDVLGYLKEFKDWNEYYVCDATYRNWLKIELQNAKASHSDLSVEEKQRAVSAAKETLGSSLSLLLRKENPWLTPTEHRVYHAMEPVFLEVHATAMLCTASGECILPDAILCTMLTSALHSSVTEAVALERRLTVNVTVSSTDNYCIEVVLRCLAVEGDGIGPHEVSDGGILATVMAAGFKGELARFQDGVTMDISRLDARYSNAGGSVEDEATYIVRGLCRRCCIPELILRCMQVSVSMAESGELPETHDGLIELVACPESGFMHLFSRQQLQEFLSFEREFCIRIAQIQEGGSS